MHTCTMHYRNVTSWQLWKLWPVWTIGRRSETRDALNGITHALDFTASHTNMIGSICLHLPSTFFERVQVSLAGRTGLDGGFRH
jgi:hypothetical protein